MISGVIGRLLRVQVEDVEVELAPEGEVSEGTNWILVGVGLVVVLGIFYWMLRKRKG